MSVPIFAAALLLSAANPYPGVAPVVAATADEATLAPATTAAPAPPLAPEMSPAPEKSPAPAPGPAAAPVSPLPAFPEVPAPDLPQNAPPAPGLAVPPLADRTPRPDTSNDIVVTGRRRIAADPLASINVQSYEAIQAIDDVFVGPVAMGYKKGVPGPVRDGLRNFLNNLNEPVVFVNYLLQLKPGKALHTVARFALNSTIGIAGLVDVAKRKPFYLAWHDNGFANTLGCYGVKPGAFLYVPLVGSTTVRDLFGLLLDQAFLPAVVGKPFNRPWYTLPAGAIRSLNDRVDLDAQLKQLRASDDPYAATRTLYFKQRAAEINDLCGRHKRPAEPDAPAEATVSPVLSAPPVLSVPPISSVPPVSSVPSAPPAVPELWAPPASPAT